MCTVLVTYDKKNKLAATLMKALSQISGVEIDDEALLTADEIRRIEKSRKSGLGSLEELKKILRA